MRIPHARHFPRSLYLRLVFGILLACPLSVTYGTDPSLNVQLVSPQNGAVLNDYPRTATLKWTGIFGAAKYLVEVECAVPDLDTRKTNWMSCKKEYVTTPQFNLDTFPGAQQGRWRVTAIDIGGGKGATSDWRTFRFTR